MPNTAAITEVTVDEALRQAQELFAQQRFAECRDLCNRILQAVPRHPQAIQIFGRLPQTITYDEEFYRRQAPISYQSARILLAYLFAHYRPNSVVDFGAGVGTWLLAAHELGVQRCIGVEGDWVKGKIASPALEYRFANLNEGIGLSERFDLAISVEVAEHLVPERAVSFVSDICCGSDLVMFGAAMPHQGGDGHLNEQPPSFWISLFQQQGYKFIDFFRAAFWARRDVDACYVQNSFLFLKSGDPREQLFPYRPLIDVYHPRLVNQYVLRQT